MKNRNKVYDSLILIMQFGINMIVPIFLCIGLGVLFIEDTASVAGDSAVFPWGGSGIPELLPDGTEALAEKRHGKG